MELKDVKVNEIYKITNLNVPSSSSDRCCMVRGKDVERTLTSFGWTNYALTEVGIPEPVTREPTTSEKVK